MRLRTIHVHLLFASYPFFCVENAMLVPQWFLNTPYVVVVGTIFYTFLRHKDTLETRSVLFQRQVWFTNIQVRILEVEMIWNGPYERYSLAYCQLFVICPQLVKTNMVCVPEFSPVFRDNDENGLPEPNATWTIPIVRRWIVLQLFVARFCCSYRIKKLLQFWVISAPAVFSIVKQR